MNLIRPLALSLSLVLAHAAVARDLRLPAAAATDIAPTTLTSAPLALAKAQRLESKPVQFSWVLPADQAQTPVAPYLAESREFWMRVSASDLQTGKRFLITAPEALIRLSPIGDSKVAIDPLQVEVSSAQGSFARGQGLKNSANAAELKSAGASFPSGTLAFQLKAEVGQGELQLRVPKAANDYLLHVYEPNSQETLSLQADRVTVVHGQTFSIRAKVNAGASVDAIGGFLSAPNGYQLPLTFERQGEQYVAKVAHDGLAGEGEGLWEIHTFSSHDGVQRDAKTAIVSSVPRARLSGQATSKTLRDGSLSLALGIEVAAASRYEVRAVLIGQDGAKSRAGAMASTAAMLKPGQQSLTLIFDADTLAKSGLQAPYRISELSLTDQATLAVQSSRAGTIEL